jgi:uncharacterized membrane protein
MNETAIAFLFVGLSTGVVAWVLHRRGIGVTPAGIAATLPWFGVIGVVVAVGRSVPMSGVAVGISGSPTVYLVVGTLVGGLWIVLDAVDADIPAWTAGSGVLTTGVVGVGSLRFAESVQPRVLLWNTVAIVLAVVITATVVWVRKIGRRPRYGLLGAGVLFAHVLDATTTGVGLERLGASERNPISAAVIQFGDGVGASGVVLFLIVKMVVALLVLTALSPDVEQPSRETVALLVVTAGAGLVPAVHNLVLFTLTFG